MSDIIKELEKEQLRSDLPELEIGDLVAVSNAGAYACTLSVQRFSSHRPPAELLVDGDGNVL